MSCYTLEEIGRQSASWLDLLALAQRHAGPLNELIHSFLDGGGELVLTGAGSSEYIGKTLAPWLGRHVPYDVRACGTTDIVTAPEECISPRKNTVLLSFARSGDSPESLGAVAAAEAVSDRVRQVIFTCNREGALSRLGEGNPDYYVIPLPGETNDRGFAMTNSFTSMYLLALLCLAPGAEREEAVRDLAAHGAAFLAQGAEPLTRWAGAFPFGRVVYLGAGAMKGLAQESALKMLELTRGQVAALFETPVGFRHGPKSFVSDNTLTVLYLSDDPFARRYELDLLGEMSRERGQNKLLVLSGQPCPEAVPLADYAYCFGNERPYENGLLAPELLLAAQVLALHKSLACGVDPDNPNPAGVVNRVVKGVTIYPYSR